MKRFGIGEFEGIKFSSAVRKTAPIKFACINEEFEAGTSTGIQYGNKGDFLLFVDNGFKVVSASDFKANYDVVKKAESPKAPEETKKVVSEKKTKSAPKVVKIVKVKKVKVVSKKK